MDITSELTIVIPVRVDSYERKENLDMVLLSLLEMTEASIIILEADMEKRYFFDEWKERVKFIFIHDKNIVFHRTHYLNKLIQMSGTDIVGVWDADVILHPSQIKEGTTVVKNGTTLCYPYDGRFLFLDIEQSNNVRNNILSFSYDKNKESMTVPVWGRPSVGGVFIINKQRYLQAGGENENIYGWGPEDVERVKRMEILEEPVERVSGPLFHLYHPRGINSTFGHDERDRNNLKELIKVCKMNTEELRKYIKTWK